VHKFSDNLEANSKFQKSDMSKFHHERSYVLGAIMQNSVTMVNGYPGFVPPAEDYSSSNQQEYAEDHLGPQKGQPSK
jgi:hypothetical protein